MQTLAMLMTEHRVIEKVIALIDDALVQIESKRRVDPAFVDAAVDFIGTYAGRTHHGKEEDILFRDLETRQLSADDRHVMTKLMDDHVFGRQTTMDLMEANARYRKGDAASFADVVGNLRTLARFYPLHIQTEDAVFFPACKHYYGDEEDRVLAARFTAFDAKMIHAKYESVAERLAKTPAAAGERA